MIRIEPATPPLTPREQFGLDVLVDLSCALVVRTAPPTAGDRPDVGVSLRPVSGDGGPAGIVEVLAGGFQATPGLVTVSRSLLAAVAEVAGAGAEQRSVARDRHDRVPSAENPLAALGAERTPIVSESAVHLRETIARAAGDRPTRWIAPWPDRRRWSAAFTHDIDVVSLWPLFTGRRVRELLLRNEHRVAGAVLWAAVREAFGDPVGQGIEGVLETERRHSVSATWFVLCGTPTATTFRRGDLTYRPESARATRAFSAVRAAGHEIGLHGSFATAEEPAAFQEQRRRLERLIDAPVVGVRQHYLRMRPGPTQHAMMHAAFSYDSTYAFPDRNGFRLGAADVVPAWDEAAQRMQPLDEVPLVWMDRAQSKYQQIEDPQRWIDDAIALADAARRVNGLWVGLWHPNLTPALGYPGAPAAYERLVSAVMSNRPYVATLRRIVAWRALRRAVRGRVAPGGDLHLEGPDSREYDVEIEDGNGQVVAILPQTPRLQPPARTGASPRDDARLDAGASTSA